jgi:hypothetical protein
MRLLYDVRMKITSLDAVNLSWAKLKEGEVLEDPIWSVTTTQSGDPDIQH